MAFPTTGVLDGFNRADGALGSNWTAEPWNDTATGFAISSNTVRGNAATFSYDWAWYNAASYGPDVEVYIDVTVAGSSEYYLAARITSPSGSASTGDGYAVYQKGTILQFARFDNGAETILGSDDTVTTLATGDGFGFEIIGSTLTAYRRVSGVWSQYGTTRTDSTYSAGGFIGMGLYEDSRTAQLDNFGGGTVVVAGSNNTRRSLLGVGR